jgi:hypothetical protein
MAAITDNIAQKLKEFKAKIIEEWRLLGSEDRSRRRIHIGDILETKNAQKCPDLEQEYMNQEKKKDGFDINELDFIKKKLKILEEADFSESREYFSCNYIGIQTRNPVQDQERT